MAYDLAFWVDVRDVRPEPNDIYQRLVDGQAVDGLGRFNTRSALAELATRFPGLVPPDGETGWTVWEAPDASSVFEFAWSSQHLIVTARGAYTSDQMNWIIDVSVDVGGGRLYDPQTRERFDSHQLTRLVGQWPPSLGPSELSCR
jgi:hypothetical protein